MLNISSNPTIYRLYKCAPYQIQLYVVILFF